LKEVICPVCNEKTLASVPHCLRCWQNYSLQVKPEENLNSSEVGKNYTFSTDWVCRVCNYIGLPSKRLPGDPSIVWALWITILPGVLYSIWRQKNKYYICPKCCRRTIIPTTSPAGSKIIQRHANKNAQ
jgi:hypothetical protein